MATIQLENTAEQVKLTLSEFYNRLINGYIGPYTGDSSASAGFLIQNGNRGNGILVANNGTTFYNNLLNFNSSNADLCASLFSSRNFVVTGNGSVMKFTSNGSLSLGRDIDSTYQGLQIYNTTPGIVLRDTDATDGAGCQFIRFLDSTGYNHSSIIGERRVVGCQGSATYNTLNICTQCILRLGNPSGAILLAKDNKLTIFSGENVDPTWNVYIGTNMFVRTNIEASGICSNSYIDSTSTGNIQRGSGNCVGFTNIQQKIGCCQFIDFSNASCVKHTSIQTVQNANGSSCLDFLTTPAGAFSTDRRVVALRLDENKKGWFQGDVCGYNACFKSLRIEGLLSQGARTYLSPDAAGYHWFGTALGTTLALPDGSLIGYGFSQTSGRVIEHQWAYNNTGLTNSSFAILSEACGFRVCHPITSCCSIQSSGNLFVSNASNCSTICQACICLLGYNTSAAPITISGKTCFSGEANFNSLVKAATLCSTDANSISCFASCVKVSSNFEIGNNVFCVSGTTVTVNGKTLLISGQNPTLDLTATCVSGCAFHQTTASGNCFFGPLYVGSNAQTTIAGTTYDHRLGNVDAKNTAKAWGDMIITNGFVVSATNLATNANLYNICCMHFDAASCVQPLTPIASYSYAICFCNPIRYPFSFNASVIAQSSLPFVGVEGICGTCDFLTSNNANYTAALTAHLIAGRTTCNCNFVSFGNRNGFGAGTYFNSLNFVLTDYRLAATDWSDYVRARGSDRFPNPGSLTSVPSLQDASVLRLNFLRANVHFTIH